MFWVYFYFFIFCSSFIFLSNTFFWSIVWPVATVILFYSFHDLSYTSSSSITRVPLHVLAPLTLAHLQDPPTCSMFSLTQKPQSEMGKQLTARAGWSILYSRFVLFFSLYLVFILCWLVWSPPLPPLLVFSTHLGASSQVLALLPAFSSFIPSSFLLLHHSVFLQSCTNTSSPNPYHFFLSFVYFRL